MSTAKTTIEEKEEHVKERNYFEELYNIDVSDKTEEKNGLTYLSWAFAWAEMKKRYPKSYYTIYENDLGWNYFTDGRTCWVKTGVTAVFEDGTSLEHIEDLPIMDYRNASISKDKVTSYDVNKSIQRSLTKACARHGVGLYVYAGEDLPEDAKADLEDAKARLSEKKKEVIKAGLTLIDNGVAKVEINKIVSKHNGGSANPNTIVSIESCDAIMADLKKLEKKLEAAKTEEE